MPSHELHLDLSFLWGIVWLRSLGRWADDGGIQAGVARDGEVDRGLSIIAQAPLGWCGVPPGLLSFGLWPLLFWRLGVFTAKHSRVSNPSLFLSLRGRDIH